MSDLSSLFAGQRSSEVEWNGLTLHSVLFLPDSVRGFVVRFERFVTDPVQGLGVGVDRGRMSCDGVSARDFRLWTDTAPSEAELHVEPSWSPQKVAVWNVWRHGGDDSPTLAWTGNAAMTVDPMGHEDGVRLGCSDGDGDPRFDDLEVTIRYL